jgi:hypothetical protein
MRHMARCKRNAQRGQTPSQSFSYECDEHRKTPLDQEADAALDEVRGRSLASLKTAVH